MILEKPEIETTSRSATRKTVVQIRYWAITIALGVLVFAFGLFELMLRRQSTMNLYLTNKSLASTAFLLISASYVLSAIYRFAGGGNQLLVLRRYLGLAGFGLAVLHIACVWIVRDPERPEAFKFGFPDYFLEHIVAITFGLAAFIIFAYVFKLSLLFRKYTGTAQKTRLWRRKLRYGYVAVLLVFSHSFLLKYEGWTLWLATFDPLLPPLSLIVSTVIFFLIVLKIVQLAVEKRIF